MSPVPLAAGNGALAGSSRRRCGELSALRSRGAGTDGTTGGCCGRPGAATAGRRGRAGASGRAPVAGGCDRRGGKTSSGARSSDAEVPR